MQDASLLRASRFEYWNRTGRNEEEGTEWKVKVRLSAIFRTSLHTSLCAFERTLKEMSCSLRWHLSFLKNFYRTRLFVKYDSSFGLWSLKKKKQNKYRQTRVFVKLQRNIKCLPVVSKFPKSDKQSPKTRTGDRSLFNWPNGSSRDSETAITDSETIEDLSLKWKLQVFGFNRLPWKMEHVVHW